MSFMKPSALYMFLITYVSFRWMPCQSWGFLRWPGLDGFLRLLVVVLLWSMFSEIRYITSNSMHPTLREHDRVIIEKGILQVECPRGAKVLLYFLLIPGLPRYFQAAIELSEMLVEVTGKHL